MSEAGIAALTESGAPVPAVKEMGTETDEDFPTGSEYRATYLLPLVKWLEAQSGCSFRFNTEVITIGRGNLFKGDMGKAKRGAVAFRTLVASADTGEAYLTSDAVVDASGTYTTSTYLVSNSM